MVHFVHVMQNDRYDGELRVGCGCAGYMEEDLEGARRRETDFKNSRTRRSLWLVRAWRTSGADDDFINTHDGFNVVVYERGGIWGARVEHRPTGLFRSSKRPTHRRTAPSWRHSTRCSV